MNIIDALVVEVSLDIDSRRYHNQLLQLSDHSLKSIIITVKVLIIIYYIYLTWWSTCS